MKAILSSCVNKEADHWDFKLQYIQFAYNTAVHATNECTPFELVYGRKPKVPMDLLYNNPSVDLNLTPDDYAKNLSNTMRSAFEEAKANQNVKLKIEKYYYDRTSRAASYAVGDEVLLLDTATKPGQLAKFKKRWKGPFIVMAKLSDLNYQIKPYDRRGKRIIVHQNRLKTCFV
jgi:hypothetical protein